MIWVTLGLIVTAIGLLALIIVRMPDDDKVSEISSADIVRAIGNAQQRVEERIARAEDEAEEFHTFWDFVLLVCAVIMLFYICG